MHKVVVIAKKEFTDNWRNRWIVAVSGIFLALTLITSYAGTRGNIGWKDAEGTVAIMLIWVQLLVPIIALMLGYAAIVGEKERGSLQLLLSYPVERFEVVLGKFFGLGAVLFLAVLVGFGGGGLVIGLQVEDMQWGDYGIFLGVSVLLGLAFIAVSMAFSALFAKRSTALGAAVFTWLFFSILWNLVLTIVAVVVYGTDVFAGGDWTPPDWYYAISIANPISAFSALVALTVTPIAGALPTDLPSFYSWPVMLLVLLTWIIAFAGLGIYLLEKRDL
jgi:ABC-type transport system involved in multi-copper enzyme maturation permease subunit